MDYCDAFFAPPSNHRKGHVFHVIVFKKGTLQVIDDNVDGPVGGIPHLGIVISPGGNNLDLNGRFFKIWERTLPGRLRNSAWIIAFQCSSKASVNFFIEGSGCWKVSVTTALEFVPVLCCSASGRCPV